MMAVLMQFYLFKLCLILSIGHGLLQNQCSFKKFARSLECSPIQEHWPHRLMRNFHVPETTAQDFTSVKFAQLNTVQIKRFNFHILLMWWGYDLSIPGLFTVAVSWLRYTV